MLTPQSSEKMPGGRLELRQKGQEHCSPSTPTKRQQRPSGRSGTNTASTAPLLSTPPPTLATPLRFSRYFVGPSAPASNSPTDIYPPASLWSTPPARLATPSHRAEPGPSGSDHFLAWQLRLVKGKSCEQIRDHHASRPPSGASNPTTLTKPAKLADMADFLASFDINNDAPAPSSSGQCTSVDELATRLRDALDLKTHETRAEHVAVTLELHNTVQFSLSLSESENEAIENLNSVGPSLGGARSASMSVDPAGQQATRMVAANDTLMKQSENPVLQRTVAKHILGAISEKDGSNWNLRDLSRGTHGWTFTYLCRDSLQHWNRQNAKNPSKAIVGEYSEREPDPTLMSRPAFDCRGSITIAFNRSNRRISVKYDHTLIHKTVEELSKLYSTPEREYGPGYVRQQQQKTPKKSKGGENKEKKPRKKRASQAAGDENGERPKKRKRKNNGKAAAADSAQGDAAAREQAAASGVVPFNVSPEESARRLTLARKLLSDAGVNPDTLSSDQMNIFSNQSPELQNDSVSMLAKYGAERLQIIHPNNKDKSGPDQSTSAATPTQAAPMTTTKELAPGSEKKGGRKRKSTAKAADASEATPKKGRKLGKSRLSCLNCKSRRVKCNKERPACAECEAEGQTCEYPPQPVRNRQKKSEAIVVEDDEEEAEEEDEDEEMQEDEYQQDQSHMEQHPEPQDHHDSAYPEPHQPDMSYSQPAADMLTPNAPDIPAEQPSYFQSASGLVLPQPTMSHGSQQAMSNASGLALPQAQPYQAPEPQVIETPVPLPTTPPVQNKRKSRGGPRRSLPAGPAGGGSAMNSPQANTASGSWTAANNPALDNGAINNVAAVGVAQQAARNQQRSRQSNRRMPTDSPQMRDYMVQPAQQSPQMVAAMQAQARTSPFQAAVQQRTTSPQDQRAQSRTPSTDQQMAGGFHPPGQNQGNDLIASSNYNNYGRYTTGSVARNDQSSNRIAYEPYSQQQSSAPATSSYPAFDYGRGASAATTTAPSFNPSASTANQWTGGSQTRSSRNYDDNGDFGTGAYGQGSQQPGSASMRNFDMRGSAQKGSGSAAAMNKQRQQAGYSQYGSQSQGQDQQMGQHEWNYFGNNNQGWI